MIIDERQCRHEHVMDCVRQMMTAARTAPKGKGMDIIEIAAIDGKDIELLSKTTAELGHQNGHQFFLRDAENILSAEAVLLIGTQSKTHALNCGHCGYSTCGEKPAPVPCALNTIDAGIAIGSACATAADMRLDTRVMFSAGYAAQSLNLLPGCRTVFAIPVSASSKNPFFDRSKG
ncbi:MAG: DUF2148 domain-containing protein [Bacteroidales bacterium]|jgi:uncharacterized ferredoxin-like protein|nr:DUF2148 domain-containing protein [Bacteroidales bacterium]